MIILTTARPLSIANATDAELVDMVDMSASYGSDFRDHLYAEFATRFPYITVQTLAHDQFSGADVFLRTERDRMIEYRDIITTPGV